MKKVILVLAAAQLMLTACTQNSTLLGDTLKELQGESASDTGSSSTSGGPKLWVVGGTSGQLIDNLSTVLSYSVSTNKWTTESTSGTYTPVSFAAYAKYGTKIYVFGGFNASGTVQSTTQIFDTATLTWSSGGSLPSAMAHGTAVVVGSKILVLGGTSVNASTAWAVSTLNALYDPATDTATAQTALGAMTGQGSDKCAVADGTAVIHNTSRTGAATINAMTQQFFLNAGVSPATPTTTTLGTAFTNRSGVACVLYSPGTPGNINFIITIGGLTTNTSNTGGFVAYNPTAWTSATTVQSHGAPYTGAWQTGLALPVATSFAAAAILNNVLYVVGGNTGSGAANRFTATNAVYATALSPNGTAPPLLSWSTNVPGTSTPLATLPGPRWGHGLIAMP